MLPSESEISTLTYSLTDAIFKHSTHGYLCGYFKDWFTVFIS